MIMRSITSRVCSSMVMSATVFLRETLSSGARTISASLLSSRIWRLRVVLRFLSGWSERSCFSQLITKKIMPVVMSSWPGNSLTHLSLSLPLAAGMQAAEIFCSAHFMHFSTSMSQASTAPSTITLRSKETFSPSGEFMPSASKVRLPCAPGSMSCSELMPSKHFLMWRCTCVGSLLWPMISSRSSFETK